MEQIDIPKSGLKHSNVVTPADYSTIVYHTPAEKHPFNSTAKYQAKSRAGFLVQPTVPALCSDSADPM